MEQKNITRKDVVDAVFNWRIANKVSQAGLAKRIKVSQAFINKVEKGIKSPSDKFTLGAIDVMEGK